MSLTPSQILKKINDMVVGLKSDNVWDNITEAYLMAGVNFGGITVKLKSLPDEVVYESDFSAGTNGWGAENGTGFGNIDGIGGQDDCYRFTYNTVDSYHQISKSGFVNGATYQVSFDVYLPSSNSICTSISWRTGGGSTEVTTETDKWVSYSTTTVFSGDRIRIIGTSGLDPAGDDVFYIRNVRVTKLNSRLTNNNFVSGDYQATGSGAGLSGDGSTKYLDTGLASASIPTRNSHLSAYLTAEDVRSYRWIMGSEESNAVDRLFMGRSATTFNFYDSIAAESATTPLASYSVAGMNIGTRTSSSDGEIYDDGSAVSATDNFADTGRDYAGNIYLFGMNQGGSPVSIGGHTITFASAGTSLTDTDAANLSLRVNKLMYDLGCNVYNDINTLGDFDEDAQAYFESVFNAGGNFE